MVVKSNNIKNNLCLKKFNKNKKPKICSKLVNRLRNKNHPHWGQTVAEMKIVKNLMLPPTHHIWKWNSNLKKNGKKKSKNTDITKLHLSTNNQTSTKQWCLIEKQLKPVWEKSKSNRMIAI